MNYIKVKLPNYLINTRLLNVLFCGFFLLIFCLICTDLTPRKALDTIDYIDISEKWFEAESVDRRSIGYPIMIWFQKGLFGENWEYSALYTQIILYIFSAITFWFLIESSFNRLPNVFITIIVLFCFLNPQSIAFTQVLLPESYPLFFCLSSIQLYFWIDLKKASFKFRNEIFGFLSALFAFISFLLKPIWLLIPISIFISELIKMLINKRLVLKVPLYFGFPFFIYYLTFSYYLNVNNQESLSGVKNINLNLSFLRMGIIQKNNSKLYEYLEKNDLVEYVNNRKWTDNLIEYEKFQKLKKIPKIYLIDSHYWKNAISQKDNYILFFYKTIKRIPSFFSTSAENGNVKIFGSNLLNYLYQAFYGFIHKNFSFLIVFHFLLIVFLIINKNEILKNSSFLVVISFLVLAFAITSTVFSYQDQTFLRVRAGINPIVNFMFIYPICYFLSNYKSYFNKNRFNKKIET